MSVAVPATALGAGGLKPSEAPPVLVGQHYFGSTAHPANNGNYEYDFWRLPPLIARDLVTVAWSTTGLNSICVMVNVDDFDWTDNECNGSNEDGISGGGSQRARLEVTASGNEAFLVFNTCCTGYPYDFAIESIQHSLGLGLRRVFRIRRQSVIVGTAVLANGKPVPNGLGVTLQATWRGGKKRMRAVTRSGNLRFVVRLPRSAAGRQVTFRALRAQDASFRAAGSPVMRARVAGVRR